MSTNSIDLQNPVATQQPKEGISIFQSSRALQSLFSRPNFTKEEFFTWMTRASRDCKSLCLKLSLENEASRTDARPL
jgi:hypothetical protein